MTAEASDRQERRDLAPARSPGPDGPPAMLTMYSPLSAIVRPDPPTVPLDATIRETLETMDRLRLGFIVVADRGRGIPLGTFALEDLARRVALPGADLEQPIAAVMTSGLVTLAPHASAHQAVLTMARHDVRHVVVVDADGRLAGVASRDDLFRLQQVGVEEIGDAIQAARDVAGLRSAALGIRRLAETLLAQGIHPETLTQSISTLNDLLTIRLIELVADTFDLPPVPICWLALGSEGRLEQTFSTDQDNGLIFEADEADAEEVRRALLPFARAVNEALDACGFPLCKGNIMASNPQWCLTVPEWQATFLRWIARPEPEALLHAAIFFDFRPVYGRAALAERLREWLLPAVMRRPLFLALMARNALRCLPPLGTFRAFVCDRSKEFPHTIDLKKHGSLIFVDAARILSLAGGLPHTSTTERLRAVAKGGDGASLAAILDGFYFIHAMRLRNQLQPSLSPGGENRVDPRRLNDLERSVLREALRQAGRLQARLASDYRVEGWG